MGRSAARVACRVVSGEEPRQVGERTMRTARGILALGSGEVVGKLGTLVLVISAARALGPEQFGVFSFALSLGTLVAIIPSWGFDTVVVQQGSAEPARLAALLAQLLVLRGAVSAPVLAAAGAALLYYRGGGAAGWASVLVLLACLADTIADGYRAVATAREAQGRCAAVQIAQRLVGAVLVVAVIVAGGGLLEVAGAYLAGSVVGVGGMAFVIARLGITPAWRSVRRIGLRAFGRTSGVMGVHGVLSMALLRVDAVLLGLIAGDAAVGLYAAAYRLLDTVLFVAYSVSRAVFPVIASSSDRWRMRRGVERGAAVLATAFLPYAAVLLLRGQDVLDLLYGTRFSAGGAPILAWLALAPLLYGMVFLAADVLLARGTNPWILAGSISGLAVNLALNLLLIPSLQGLGAAVATTVSYLVEAAVLAALVVRREGVVIAPRTLAPAAGATAVAVVVLLVPLPLLPDLLLAVVAYSVVWWPLARRLDPEQTAVLRRLPRLRRAGLGGAV